MTADAPPASHVERSDALGAVELVRRDGEQVDLQRIDVDGHLADGLRRVHVEEDLFLAAKLADFGDGLDHANLVVCVHHRDQRRLRPNRRLERLEVDEAVCAHRQVGHVEALLLQPAARVEHALVLSDGRDDVVLLWMVELRHALDRHVVRLGGARGEDDLLRVGADERRHLLARRVDHLRRLPPVRVRLRVRVAVHACHVWEHRIERARIQRSGRLRIEVDGPALAIRSDDREVAVRGRRGAEAPPARAERSG
mmetsp:Transcript_40877/g.108166  ORF Transcript_40877/g.108166 Transcript_40877/m.108166 type:complete len:254 (-) Transcript_40877:75-836(-)